ncbi:MAG: sodium:proton antiporter [Bacteroidota bacterium]
MNVLDFIAILIVLAAFFTLINLNFLKLPSTIGLMLLALALSAFIILGGLVFSDVTRIATNIMTEFDFSDVLFDVMLSFLLFAGALEINLRKLGEEKWTILALATLGVLISTFVIGTVMYVILPFLGLSLSYIYCLLFGALISPTDPISVLAMLKKYNMSKNLESQIAGESLFNDGVGVVVFLSIFSVARTGVDNFEPFNVLELFGLEVGGGLLLGVVFGYIGLYLLKIIDNEHTEIEVLVTLSMVLGGSRLADHIGVSGPLAMVVMGLFVGRKGRSKSLENVAGEYVYKFWHLMDEAMNAILFILIGMQVILIKFEVDYLYSASIAIVVVLLGRAFGVGLPIFAMRIRKYFPQYTVRILTWSGLRGGISVALALSLYHPYKGFELDAHVADLITTMTYGVVLFSIVVQGLTIKGLFQRFAKANPPS